MKKIIVLLIGITMVASSCNNKPDTNTTNPPPPPASTPSMQTYNYAPYNFEFQYPAEFVFTQPNYANLSEKIVQVQLQQNAYPGTNFVDAAFAVSAQSTASQSVCLALPAGESNSGFKDNQTVNGVVYSKATGSGAAAGNLYESRIYRVWRNNICFELTETLHTGNLGNYPPNILAVDKGQVWQELDSILTTFKFN
jgi:hypothetical protein